MLDPLTAASLAGTVVQFVDFSTKVIFKARDLSVSASGAGQDAFDFEVVTRDLLRLTEELKRKLGPIPIGESREDYDRDLNDICDGCIKTAGQMLYRLQRLKCKDGAGRRTIAKIAIKTIWSQKELDALSVQLATYRSQLDLHISASLSKKLDWLDHSGITKLDVATRKVISVAKESRSVFDCALEKQNEVISSLRQDIQRDVIDAHERTQSVMLNAIRTSHPSNVTKTVHIKNPQDQNNSKLETIRRAEDRLLQSLRFTSMSDRHSHVAEAHTSTFEWIFGDSSGLNRPSNFTQWLQSSNGIFWISGKAGSGKSTLMKYLYNHRRSREHLVSWAGLDQLFVASFFFWSSGTAEQKSQVGLLRSLLYELLSTHRNLIPAVLPDQWEEIYIDSLIGSSHSAPDILWSVENMKDAFSIISAQPICICLFIDGLDEFKCDRGGSYADIVAFFQTMANSSKIKLCLSSRPWPVFEDAFRSNLRLRLEDLTLQDIARYVDDKFNKHHRMKQIKRLEPVGAHSLMQEVISRASGVFLWVTLVVKSLIEGLTNHDRISDLHRRLCQIPSDIEGLFRVMLFQHIDPVYHEESSQLIQFVFASMPRFCVTPLSLATLDLADNKYRRQRRTMTAETMILSCQELKGRLASRCAGLIEVNGYGYDPRKLTVGFLHRTAKEFLQRPDVWDTILARTEQNFNAHQLLLESYLLQLQLWRPTDGDNGWINAITYHLCNIFQLARTISEHGGGANIAILEETENIVEHLSRTQTTPPQSRHILSIPEPFPHPPHCPLFVLPRRGFLELQRGLLGFEVEYCLTEYLRHKFSSINISHTRFEEKSLLHYFAYFPPDTELLSLLFKYRSNPNHLFEEQSPWQHAVTAFFRARSNCRFSTSYQRARWQLVLRLFLKAGADANALCRSPCHHDMWGRNTTQFAHMIFTPLHLFSPSGRFPSSEMETILKARGGVDFMEDISRIKDEDRERYVEVEVIPRLRAKIKEANRNKFSRWTRALLELTRS